MGKINARKNMKYIHAVLTFVFFTSYNLPAQSSYTVTERGPDFNVHQKTTIENGTNRVHRYVELATGLNYTNAYGQLVESKEEITIQPGGGAAATQGRHKVYFPANIYNGVIEVVTPDGKHLKSRPLGVSYDDGSNTVFIAELKSANGYLTGPNQVTYRDAFTDFKADLVCVYRRGGFECDLVLRQQPPTPEDFGLDESFSTLSLVTEFFDTTDPEQIPAASDEWFGLQDTMLKFGKLTMTHGKAFAFNGEGDSDSVEPSIPVYKNWVVVEGRKFLIESVPVIDLAEELGALPLTASISPSKRDSSKPKTLLASVRRQFPAAHEITACTNEIQLALAAFDREPGVVLDYNTIVANTSDYTFSGGITYYINGAYWLMGVTTIEGGAVFKCASTNNSWLNVMGTLNCQTSPDHPAIFTVKDDDSVGEILPDSTGNPTTSANQTMAIYCSQDYYSFSNTAPVFIHDCKIRYLQTGIGVINFASTAATPPTNEIRNCEFHAVKTAIVVNGSQSSPMQMRVRNVLINGATEAFFIWNHQNVSVENATLHHVRYRRLSNPSPTLITFTNSLFVSVTNLSEWNDTTSTMVCVNCDTNSSDVGVFDANAVAGHYLSTNSPYRNHGTTNINFNLLAELQAKTTYPPTVLIDTNITSDIIFSPQVSRDNDGSPDLGYHYPAVDFVVGGATISGATAKVYPGTVIAAVGTSNHIYGLNLVESQFICKGLATNWNKIFEVNGLLAYGNGWKKALDGLIKSDANSKIDCRFTHWSAAATNVPHLNVLKTPLFIRDCEFHRGSLNLAYTYYGGSSSIETGPSEILLAVDPALKNCLFENVDVTLDVEDGSPTFVQNNFFHGGTLDLIANNGSATVQNNLFLNTVIPDRSSYGQTYTGGFNAYLTNCDTLLPASTNDLILTTAPAFHAGRFGNYYQSASSPLINAGGTNAAVLGLYDYTVLTDIVSGTQIKETNGTVDIGYHYIAVDASGNPVSTYTNGIPDYFITSSSDEMPDWWQWLHFGNISQPVSGDYDQDGTTNLLEYLNETDPNKISFSFLFPRQYVTTSNNTAIITIFGGEPSSMAVLVDSTNFASATWSAYQTSFTVNLGSTQGAHNVWVGLRGRLTASHQTWSGTTLVLDSTIPTILITNPVANVFLNASRVNVSGYFSSASLKQITVNGMLAFVKGTNFEALNVPVDGGTNFIIATVENLTGVTNADAILVNGVTNLNGSLNNPVTLAATPVAGFAPLMVTFSVQTNLPGTLQQVSYDFNGDAIADFTTNNLDSFAYTYSTNGEYFPVITVQTTAGRFSSVGGWNSYAHDLLRVSVSGDPVLVSTINITDPVDLKSTAAGELYVLSRSTATVTEYDTNGAVIRSLDNLGSNPTGLDVDAVGNIYVAVNGGNQLWKFHPSSSSFYPDAGFGTDGCIGLVSGATGTNTAEFNAPFDVAVSPDGQSIFVSDSGNHRLQQFSAETGAFITTFGSQGNAIGQFDTPKGLTFDAAGLLYVVDSGNNRIVTTLDSLVLGASGTNGTALGHFSSPVNVSIGKRGVYVADTGNSRIQKFDAPEHGAFSIAPATTRFGFSTNFNQPTAVAAVQNYTNELFCVADTENDRVTLWQVPSTDAAMLVATWIGMTNRMAAGDFSGVAAYFSSGAADKYRQAFVGMGAANAVSVIGEIGALIPAVIEGDTAQSYFEKTIDGQTITFPVEFVKENGVWKIAEF